MRVGDDNEVSVVFCFQFLICHFFFFIFDRMERQL